MRGDPLDEVFASDRVGSAFAAAYSLGVPWVLDCRSSRTDGLSPLMAQVAIDVPEGALAALRTDPDGYARELCRVAAIKWYEVGSVSQGRAAEIAGVSRAEFLDALGRHRVSPFQYSTEEILAEAERGD